VDIGAGGAGRTNEYIIRVMSVRVRAALLIVLIAAGATAACGGRIFGKPYEYEEDLYLATDGSADLIVNASIPALVALRGLSLDVEPNANVDRDAIRAAYQSPDTEVTRVSRPWRRDGRRFVQIRIKVHDIRSLHTAAPFSWSRYEFTEQNGERVYRQAVGASALRPGTLKKYVWKGQELVALRLHMPSRIIAHYARDIDSNEGSVVQRGNILAWEQLLTERLDGRPIDIEVRMDRQSILYTTLWLFAGAFAAAVLVIGLILWLTVRKGAREAAPSA
jgi:hypothetical protein